MHTRTPRSSATHEKSARTRVTSGPPRTGTQHVTRVNVYCTNLDHTTYHNRAHTPTPCDHLSPTQIHGGAIKTRISYIWNTSTSPPPHQISRVICLCAHARARNVNTRTGNTVRNADLFSITRITGTHMIIGPQQGVPHPTTNIMHKQYGLARACIQNGAINHITIRSPFPTPGFTTCGQQHVWGRVADNHMHD